jgi:hypothetical protein
MPRLDRARELDARTYLIVASAIARAKHHPKIDPPPHNLPGFEPFSGSCGLIFHVFDLLAPLQSRHHLPHLPFKSIQVVRRPRHH